MQFEQISLQDMGWNTDFAAAFVAASAKASHAAEGVGLVPARVTEELKGFHRVRTEHAVLLAETASWLHKQIKGQSDFPAVGDWVGIVPRLDEGRARIECVLPRRTKLSRKVAGRVQAEQMIATNLDTVFVVSALNREFNLRRIERYLAVVWESGAQPVVLLNKSDLCAEAAERKAETEGIAAGAPVYLLAATDGVGMEKVRQYLVRGETAAFIGSSGVGKSTIINMLTQERASKKVGSAPASLLRVRPVREADDTGQHTTTSRQMIFLPEGGLVIDTPGMRELQLWGSDEGAAQVFDDIAQLALTCKFRDCTHNGEPGCAVEAAILTGTLERERLGNHRKMQDELQFQKTKVEPVLAQQGKKKWKKAGKETEDSREL